MAAACRDKDFDKARHLLAAGANPKGSTCGFFNWTALHFCCQYGELVFAKELIETYGINPEAEDKEGRTPLHITCQFGHITIAQYLISKCRCNPDYLDFEEQTPLHHAAGWLSECSESNALKIVEFLISSAQCNPHHKDLNGKNALLHACEKGFLTVIQYLINNCGSSATETDNHGNSCLHLAASYANNLQMVKYLIKLTPRNACSPNGNTVLHAACAANSDLDIIKYLLIAEKCDPNSRNEKGEQPLDLTTNKEIKRMLYMHGATPDNVLEKHGAVLGDVIATDCRRPTLKVLVLGNHSSGKSTLIKSIQREGSSFVFSFSQQRTAKNDEHIEGLQVVDFQNKSGRFSFYNFGGEEAYRCSHGAILHHILYHSTAAVILMINLCESIEKLRSQIFNWLTLVNDNCNTVRAQLHVIVLGSHSDMLKCRASKIWEDLNVDQQFSRYSKLDLLESIALDCQRFESTQMTKLRQHLTTSYQSLCSPEPIHFNALCLYSIFETRLIGSLAISIQDLYHQVSVSEDSNISATRIEYFIPGNEQLLIDLCIYMNDVGLAMYLHRDNTENSIVILNSQLFLNVLTAVFTPSPSYRPTANNSGLICSSTLLPYKCDVNMAVNVLVQLEVCQAIPVNCVIQKFSNSDETLGNQYLYLPALSRNSVPNSVWEFDSRFKCHFGWTLRFGTKVSSRVIEVLLVRISSTLLRISQYQKVHFICWKDGISVSSGHGCEFIAEVNNGATCILIIVRSITSTLTYLKLRSQLISVCCNVVNELCRGIVTEELFIDPFEAVQYPLKPSPYIAYFTFTEIMKAIKDTDATVQSITGDKLLIKDLIGHDPYIDLGPELLHYVSDSQVHNSVISDDHLHQLASIMKSNDYFSELFLLEEVSSNAYQALLEWCKRAKGTYQSLREVLNQASVLANRAAMQ